MEDKKIKSLLKLDDYSYYLYLLKADVFRDRIENMDEIIRQSMDCARLYAKELKEQKTSLSDLKNKYGLVFKEGFSQNIFNLYDLAIFESPNKIIFHKDNIKILEDEMAKEDDSIFSKVSPKDIITCHEIYHKLEEGAPTSFLKHGE